MSKKIFQLFLCVSALCTSLHLNGTEDVFRARVRFFNPFADTKGVYYMNLSGEEFEIKAPFTLPTAYYDYAGDPNVVLYRKKGSDETAQKVKVATFKLSRADQNYFVFLAPELPRDPATGYAVTVYDDSAKSLPARSTRIYNLAGAEIAIQMGDAKRRIGARDTLTLRNTDAQFSSTKGSPVEFSSSQDMPVRVGVNLGDEWRIFYRRMWQLNTDGRHHVFIVPMGGKTLRVIKLSDLE